HRWNLMVWIFAMRILMIVTSVASWKLNEFFTNATMAKAAKFNFEHPLTALVWMTSLISIGVTFLISHTMLQGTPLGGIWWKLATIISCGTLAAAVIPELTRAFTSMNSAHCTEVVDATREGGTGLTILSGLIAGDFSAFWQG